MKHYIEPKMNVLILDEEDVIVTSGPITVSDLTDCEYKSWDGISFS